MRIDDFANIKDKHNWENILSILEKFETTSSSNKHISLKNRAAEYLDTEHNEKLNRGELRMLMAKAEKLKTSTKKEERARGQELAKLIQRAFNVTK
jgi:hypothetical protein